MKPQSGSDTQTDTGTERQSAYHDKRMLIVDKGANEDDHLRLDFGDFGQEVIQWRVREVLCCGERPSGDYHIHRTAICHAAEYMDVAGMKD